MGYNNYDVMVELLKELIFLCLFFYHYLQGHHGRVHLNEKERKKNEKNTLLD